MILGRLWYEHPTLDADDDAALEALDDVGQWVQSIDPESCGSLRSLDILRQTVTHFSSRPKGWLHVVFWPSAVPQEYLDELKEERPAAVVIFIYWCAVLSNAPSTWFMDGWAQTAASHYMGRLRSPFGDLLAWPRSQFRKQKVSLIQDSDILTPQSMYMDLHVSFNAS